MNISMINGINEKLGKWLGKNIDDIYDYIKLLFLKLGFKDSDIINIVDFDKENNIYFDVNDKSYAIRIRNNSDDKYPIVYFNNKDGVEFGYQCIYRNNNDYITLCLNMFKYGVNINSNIVSYENSNEWVEYRVEVGDKILEFRLSKPRKYISNSGYYSNYEIPCHKGILSYFSKLDNVNFPSSILDIYKDLCILKIGNDINKYDDVDLRIMIKDENEYEDVKEFIQLQNGNLTSMMIKRNGMVISFNNDDNWLCDNGRTQVMFDVFKNNGIVSFNSRVNLIDIDEYSDDIVYQDMNNARFEVVNVKKLVRVMFNNKDNSDNRDGN